VNKQELVEVLAGRLEKSQKESSEIVDAVLDEIKKAVAKGESVKISGFGVFDHAMRGARIGRNPRTGETVRIEETKVVKFRPAADFKAVVAGTRRAISRDDG
jgi:DNA-binding protein HU-beta